MLLIWGFRARPTTLSEGEFFCPSCGADRHYLLQRIRRWFTFFFVPIFPTGKDYGIQVKCTTCDSCFISEVLTAPTSAALTEYIRNAVRVAADAMVAVGSASTSAAARLAAVTMVRESGAEEFDDAALTSDLGQVDFELLPAYLAPLAQGLEEQGREAFVAQLTGIALADGPLNVAETELLKTVGAGLQLTAAHVQGIIVTVQAQADGETPAGSDPAADETAP